MKKIFKVIVIPAVTLLFGLSILFTSSVVFASGNRMIEGPSGSDTYSKTTYHHAYDHSAKFESTIKYNSSTSKWYAYSVNGTATVFNITKRFYDSGLTQAFYYSGMGQSNSTFTQVENTMYHYY